MYKKRPTKIQLPSFFQLAFGVNLGQILPLFCCSLLELLNFICPKERCFLSQSFPFVSSCYCIFLAEWITVCNVILKGIIFFFTCHFIFFSQKLQLAWVYIVLLGFGEVCFFFFRKIVTVISIFFTQLLGCFSLNLVLLRGAKLTPSKSKYLCLQMWCNNTLCAKFSTGGRVQERAQRVRRHFSHCPHWILVDST